MDFTELTNKRYSVRKFLPVPLTSGEIEAILAVGANAPTACNKQPQRIYVVKSPRALAAVRECTRCHFDAPVLFVVCYDEEACWKRDYDGQPYGAVDATIVLTQMMLKVTEMGLGSTFVAWFDPVKLRHALNLPDHLQPVGMLPVGHPSPDARPASFHTARRGIAAITTEI